MKKIALAAAVMLSLGVAAGSAEAQSRPGGCLKYGLGGAVAGHFAGGHRIKGALAGCALGIYQRRQYERQVREQNEIRNRIPERRRVPNPQPNDSYENRDRSANRAPLPQRPLPRQEGTSPYEDLGLGRGGPTTREQATRGQDRIGSQTAGQGGHTSGGAFARGQQESRDRVQNREWVPNAGQLRRADPEATDSFPHSNGRMY